MVKTTFKTLLFRRLCTIFCKLCDIYMYMNWPLLSWPLHPGSCWGVPESERDSAGLRASLSVRRLKSITSTARLCEQHNIIFTWMTIHFNDSLHHTHKLNPEEKTHTLHCLHWFTRFIPVLMRARKRNLFHFELSQFY